MKTRKSEAPVSESIVSLPLSALLALAAAASQAPPSSRAPNTITNAPPTMPSKSRPPASGVRARRSNEVRDNDRLALLDELSQRTKPCSAAELRRTLRRSASHLMADLVALRNVGAVVMHGAKRSSTWEVRR